MLSYGNHAAFQGQPQDGNHWCVQYFAIYIFLSMSNELHFISCGFTIYFDAIIA